MLKNKTVLASFLGVVLLILLFSSLAVAEIVYDSGNRRDPFVPLTGEENALVSATSSGVKLEGIIYDPGAQSMAILNGKTYQAGETAGNAKVLKIFKDHVVISVGEEEKTLWIREEEKS